MLSQLVSQPKESDDKPEGLPQSPRPSPKNTNQVDTSYNGENHFLGRTKFFIIIR